VEQYLVDTTVLIDLSRGVPGIRGRLDVLNRSGAALGVCAVNVAEFASGVPTSELPRWDQLLDEFEYWDISREAAIRAGAFRDALRRKGTTLQLADALIAAVAATRGAIILSDNVKHFLPITEVRVRPLRV
jgi:predicted nucleic acid-binding protein